jgi:uncharacterized protein YegP (UPF0339 family)
MAGKFKIVKNKKGEFFARLTAGNGEVIANLEGAASYQRVLDTIDLIRKTAPDAIIVDETL